MLSHSEFAFNRVSCVSNSAQRQEKRPKTRTNFACLLLIWEISKSATNPQTGIQSIAVAERPSSARASSEIRTRSFWRNFPRRFPIRRGESSLDPIQIVFRRRIPTIWSYDCEYCGRRLELDASERSRIPSDEGANPRDYVVPKMGAANHTDSGANDSISVGQINEVRVICFAVILRFLTVEMCVPSLTWQGCCKECASGGLRPARGRAMGRS